MDIGRNENIISTCIPDEASLKNASWTQDQKQAFQKFPPVLEPAGKVGAPHREVLDLPCPLLRKAREWFSDLFPKQQVGPAPGGIRAPILGKSQRRGEEETQGQEGSWAMFGPNVTT